MHTFYLTFTQMRPVYRFVFGNDKRSGYPNVNTTRARESHAQTAHTWSVGTVGQDFCGMGGRRWDCVESLDPGLQFCLGSRRVITLSSTIAACLRGFAKPGLMNKQQETRQRIPLLYLYCAFK